MATDMHPATSQTPAAATQPRPRDPLTYQPLIDMCDCGAEVLLLADVPGARPEGINVSFEDGVLTVHAAVPPRSLPGRSVRQEYGVGDFRRSFRLGDGFDAAAISAEYRRGVLTIRLPRLASVRPRKVEVRTG
jgi:HSP20 family protein